MDSSAPGTRESRTLGVSYSSVLIHPHQMYCPAGSDADVCLLRCHSSHEQPRSSKSPSSQAEDSLTPFVVTCPVLNQRGVLTDLRLSRITERSSRRSLAWSSWHQHGDPLHVHRRVAHPPKHQGGHRQVDRGRHDPQSVHILSRSRLSTFPPVLMPSHLLLQSSER